MNPCVVDVETTIFKKGNPHAQCNKLCYVGLHSGVGHRSFSVDGFGKPYGESLEQVCSLLRPYDLLIGFNIKFDLSWIRRYGIPFEGKKVWDLQLAEFVITNQSQRMPSLDDTCRRVGIAGKIGDVATTYWDNDIDTPDIPPEVMLEYLAQDCKAEWELFHWQMKYLEDKPQMRRLLWDGCQDLLITQQMEFNGLFYDIEKSKQIGDEILQQIQQLDRQLTDILPLPADKWNSGDWLSAVLYGGCVLEDGREGFTFTYKDGRTKDKTRKVQVPRVFERLVEPLDGTKLKKEGFWSTDEGTLRKLKAAGKAKCIIELVLQRSKLEKKLGTYFYGIPKLYEEMDWTNSIIHGQLNHCVTGTGRLSSSRPNLQNMDSVVRKCIVTRFPLGKHDK